MPNQFITYVLGGIFVVVITVMGAKVSQQLLKQDQVVSFEAPMQEFIETLNREFDYNAFALRSLAQFFRSSQSVEAHEFDSYTGLVMEQFGNISAMAYFKEQPSMLNQKATLTPVYWRSARTDGSPEVTHIFGSTEMPDLYRRALQQAGPVASMVFPGPDDTQQKYVMVLLKLARESGVVGILINVGYSLEQTLNNQVSQGYSLFEQHPDDYRLVLSNHNQPLRGQEDIHDGDYVAALAFFDRQWMLSTYQGDMLHNKVAYSAIAIGAMALSMLVVYLVIQAERLHRANRDKQSAFDDLQFAQKKLIETEKIAAMGGVVAGVAHEVNTPLGVGITSTSYLQDSLSELRCDFDQGRLDAERFQAFIESSEEMVTLALNNLRRASALVAKFKKVDVLTSVADSEPEAVKIAELVDSFTERFYQEYPGSRVVVQVNVDSEIRVTTHPAALLDILLYLASNSVTHAFTREQKNCEISVTFPYKAGSNGGKLLLFKDNGIGVDKTLLKRIVDPFFTTRRGAGNAGLGLSVAYNLVKSKLNSDLNLYDDQGLAVAFELYDLNK